MLEVIKTSIDGALIKRLRKSLGKEYTQEKMASMFGVSLGAWRNWEQGINTPETAIVMKLADFFCISVDVILGRPDSPSTTVLAIDSRPERKYLMDKIAKATPDQLSKLDRLWSIIAEEDEQNS